MNARQQTVSTQELWARLFRAPTIDRFFADDGADALPSFADYITELCRSRGEKPEQILRRSDVESSFGHRLFSGGRKPSRDTALQLAFGFGLTPQETQRLLLIAQASALHPKVKRDAVIAWCLSRGLPLTEAQQLLYDQSLPLLGGKHYE